MPRRDRRAATSEPRTANSEQRPATSDQRTSDLAHRVCSARAIPCHSSSPMYEATARNLRRAERYLLEPTLAGQFGTSAVSVCDISMKGARIKHGPPLEMGRKSVLRMPIDP